MLPGHHTTTRCNAGLLLIVFEKYRCLTCRPIIQLSHHGNAVMVEWLRHLTRNQMGSSCIGLNPTRSSDSYARWPDRTTQLQLGPTPLPPKLSMWDIGAGSLCLRLNTMHRCPCSCSAALLVVKPWLVPAVTNLTCEPTPTQQAALPRHCCPAHAVVQQLELQPSTVAGTKTGQNGALPKPPTGHSKRRARQQISGPNVIPGLTSPAQHLSPVALFTSA